MSSRRLTEQQFSPGTTIDGNRLDRAMQDVLDKYNAVRPGDMTKRHTQHQVVLGWSPSCGILQPSLPFMEVLNEQSMLVTGTSVPDLGIQNPWRAKGTYNPLVDPADTTLSDQQWCWTTALIFNKPVILDGVAMFLLHDTQYTNTFQFGNPPPPGKTNGEAVDDIVVEVSVDNPFLMENRTQNAMEFHKTRWKVDSLLFNSQVLPGFTDMQPAHPTGGPVGVALDAQALNIPLPQGARIRLNMTIPEYRPGYTSGWQPTGHRPWDIQVYSIVLTFLDPLEV